MVLGVLNFYLLNDTYHILDNNIDPKNQQYLTLIVKLLLMKIQINI